MKKSKNFVPTKEEKDNLDSQINELKSQVNYDTRDYPIEVIVEKFNKQDFIIPEYQRNFIWLDSDKSLFLESLFLGLPVPFMFFAERNDGKIEIVDGAQRTQTLVQFVHHNFVINGLKKITELNGFTFDNLSDAQKRIFLNKSLRVIVLSCTTSNSAKQDLFNRINTSGRKATPAEVWIGTYSNGRLTQFILNCCENPLFKELCPMSQINIKKRGYFELILRFFAYLNNYLNFKHDVEGFLGTFLRENLNTFDEQQYKKDFDTMLNFVKKYYPCGFAKTKSAKSTPHVRFEALSVGTALALKEDPKLSPKSIKWIESEDFKKLTTSDASNNEGKLKGRIEFVRDRLLDR